MSYVVTKVSELDNAPANLDPTDIVMVAVVDGTSPTGYKTVQMTGQQIIDGVGSTPASTGLLTASSQWNKPIVVTEEIVNNSTFNFLTLLEDINAVASGTTAYAEFPLMRSVTVAFTGTSGTANININGTDYLATFNTDLYTTAQDWVSTHGATVFTAHNLRSFAIIVGVADGKIRFTASDAEKLVLNGITITNVSGDLAGNLKNDFTGAASSEFDHIIVPYDGTEYDGQRLLHTMRINFHVQTGTIQTYALSLRRITDDSIIGSEIQVNRNIDESGNQYVFESYTNDNTDPFVTGGFYFALRNDSGVTADIETTIGVLIQTIFQQPTIFP